ncbi:MAG: hypothetical protein ABI471_05505 [Sphingomonas bacterium]
MSYLHRYLAGEHEVVWRELGNLDPAMCGSDIIADAEAVALATMERVAINVDLLIERLTARSYAFGVYPDGDAIPGFRGARVKPDIGMLSDASALQAEVGPAPLSLRTFWSVVGETSLAGRAPGGGMPDYSDPLWVEGPQAGLVDLSDGPEFADEGEGGGFLCSIAPDILHKDNVSGGAPYAICLPNAGFDALLQDEWHVTNFVPYLRTAILDWGGFPGLSKENPHDDWRGDEVAAQWVNDLKKDLLAF